MKLTKILMSCLFLGYASVSLVGCTSLEQTQINPTGVVQPDMLKLIETANKAYIDKNWVEAEQQYREIVKTMSKDEFSYFRLGNTLLRQGRLDEATEFLNQAISLNPQFLEARHNLSTVYILQAERQLQTMKKMTVGEQLEAVERKTEYLEKAAATSLQ